jgi:peptidoglycan/xylan/chitin deacetylase (PgdA/CDA1 family)
MGADRMPLKLPFRMLSPAGKRARLSIFIFHRVLPSPDPMQPGEPDAARFEQIVRFVARHFHVLPFGEAARKLRAGQLPPAAACITFDDGYADNLGVAAPILARHGIPATFFVSTGFMDGGRMWNDTVIEALRRVPAGELDWDLFGAGRWPINDVASRIDACRATLAHLKPMEPTQRLQITTEIGQAAGLPSQSDLMLTRAGVLQLRDMGMEIGAHTVNHPILRSVSDRVAADEIGGSRETLAQWLGEAPRVFAYPNGVPGRDYTGRDVRLVRQAGFDVAASTAKGVATVDSHMLQLPRFTPWDQQMGRFALRCAANILQGVGPAVQRVTETA